MSSMDVHAHATTQDFNIPKFLAYLHRNYLHQLCPKLWFFDDFILNMKKKPPNFTRLYYDVFLVFAGTQSSALVTDAL